MSKKIIVNLLFFILLFMISSINMVTMADEFPSTIIISSHRVGTTIYSLTTGWAPVFEQTTGTRVRIVPEAIPVVRRNWLREGRVHLDANSMAATAADGLEVTLNDALRDGGPFPIRLVWSGSAGYLSFLVRGDSEIKRMEDVKPGIRIAYREGSPGYLNASKAFAAWAGLDPEEDITLVPVASSEAAVAAVADGRADTCYTGTTSSAVLEAQSKPHGIRFIELDPNKDQKAAERFLEYRPTLMFGSIEAGFGDSVGLVGIRAPSPYFGNADHLDKEFVYNLVKWFVESYDKYKDASPETRGMSLDNMRALLDLTYIPVHEGTIKYFKEIGMWTEEDTRRQQYNLELLKRYEEAYQEAINIADEQGISVEPLNEKWIKLWEDYKEKLGLKSFRVMTQIP